MVKVLIELVPDVRIEVAVSLQRALGVSHLVHGHLVRPLLAGRLNGG